MEKRKLSESESQKPTPPPFLNRLLRCSACAKNLVIGLGLFLGVATIVIIGAFKPFEINGHYLLFGLSVLGAGLVYYFSIYATVKLFRAYCDKDSEYYDDGFLIAMGFLCAFVPFILTVAIVYDSLDGSWFIELLERGSHQW
jgi:hypothetical protein